MIKPVFTRLSTRAAFTLIELAVAVGIIGILLALTLPAVQSLRERARKIQCQNNLRQIVLATHNFESAKQSLPSLYNETSLRYPLNEWDLFYTHSWRAMLLPYIEQTSLSNQIDFSALATDPVNMSIAQTPVPLYLCPTGADAVETKGWGATHASWPYIPIPLPEDQKVWVVRSDYDAMVGIQYLASPPSSAAEADSLKNVRWGVWGWPRFDRDALSGSRLISYRAGKFSDVSDGLSNTIAVVERGGKPIELRNGEPVFVDGEILSYSGQAGWSASDTFLWTLNWLDVGVNQRNSQGIYSLHAAGANVAMADGSVRFLSDSTSYQELVKLFSRSGGE